MSTTLAPGLVRVSAPALPRGYQIRCNWCRCTVGASHEAGSFDCLASAEERSISQSDD